MSELAASKRADSGRWWIETGILAALCLLVRSVGLMALPIFGDEAIYLRWAQLAQQGHYWVSLIDPKPPLHFWLLSGVIGWTKDPLLAARGLSVAAGVLSVPAVMGVCTELAELSPARMSGRVLGLLAAVLMIFSPFVSFYQRLALTDALFILEMLTVVWLSLRWARTGKWGWAIGIGAAMGLTLMTRQGLSYTLWGVVAAAWGLHFTRKAAGMRLLQLITAGVIAAALWSPYLLAELPRFTDDARADNPQATTMTVIKRRILYQEQFTAGQESRVSIALRNAGHTFLPFWFEPQKGGTVRQEMGWLPGYLTWPIYGLAIIGMVYWAVRGQWRVLGMVLIWGAMVLGPVVVLGNVVYSRYALSGAVVMLFPAAWMLTDSLGVIAGWKRLGWVAASVITIAVVAMGVRQVGLQGSRWWEQNLTEQDRSQYVTGWSAGGAVDQVIGILRKEAEAGPIVVVTDGAWGLPADAVWAELQNDRNVQLYYTTRSGEAPILERATGGEPNAVLLRKDKWLYTPAEPVRIDPAARVYFVVEIGAKDETTEKRLRELNPTLGTKLIFSGIDKTQDKVALFSVK